MAFNTNTNAPSNTNGIPDNKKAEGFLNFYLPRKDGGRRKLGAVILRKSYPEELTLAQWLAEDPTRVVVILEKLIIEYNAATPDESAGFDLS